jgi:hypothetical protein
LLRFYRDLIENADRLVAISNLCGQIISNVKNVQVCKGRDDRPVCCCFSIIEGEKPLLAGRICVPGTELYILRCSLE